MVMQNSMMKYITRMGQNTGTLKASKNVQIIATTMPFVAECLKHQPAATHTEVNEHTTPLYNVNITETEEMTQEPLKAQSNKAIYNSIAIADTSCFYFDWTEARADNG